MAISQGSPDSGQGLPSGSNIVGKLLIANASGVVVDVLDLTNNALAVVGVALDAFDHGSNRDVDTSAEQLTSTSMVATMGVGIRAASDNTGVVAVGNSDVTYDTTDSTDGFPLAAGEYVFIPIDNANKIYVRGSANNQKVWFIVT